MKKKNKVGKIIAGIFLTIILVLGISAFLVYRTINNSAQYEETFFADETIKYEFKDIVTYDVSTHIAHVKVPRNAFKGFVEDALRDISLPYGLTIDRTGMTLNDDQTITIIPEVKYKTLIATCPLITLSYEVKDDHIDFRFEGLYLANKKVSQLISEQTGLQKGETIATVDFPDVITDFHQCPFVLDYVSNIRCDGETISCDYDIYHALLDLYRTETSSGEDNPWFQQSIVSLKNLVYRGYKIVGE